MRQRLEMPHLFAVLHGVLNRYGASPRWLKDRVAKLLSRCLSVGRAGGIRTRGLFVPNEALYQAEPQPVKNLFISHLEWEVRGLANKLTEPRFEFPFNPSL